MSSNSSGGAVVEEDDEQADRNSTARIELPENPPRSADEPSSAEPEVRRHARLSTYTPPTVVTPRGGGDAGVLCPDGNWWHGGRIGRRLEVIEVSVQPEQERVASGDGCWCCGSEYPEAELVRLGQHPEVGVCLRCARWLQRRAVQRHDEQHPSSAARLRGGIEAVRAAVIRKGWHQRGALGVVLRWIDRHLP